MNKINGDVSVSETSYGRVADTIRNRIIGGIYRPGYKLKVMSLCSELGVSSNPIREALQQLQGERLVVIAPNKGATVRQIDERLIRDIYEINAALDALFAGRAAESATDLQILELINVHRDLKRAVHKQDEPKRAHYDYRFHAMLGEISKNVEALTLRLRHRNLIRAMRMKYGFGDGRPDVALTEHQEVLAAISARDVQKAELAAKMHCLRSCDDIIAVFHRRPA